MNGGIASWLPTLITVPLVGFLLYRRYKRTFGRQVFSPVSMTLRLVLLAIVSALLIAAVSSGAGFAALGAGAALGVGLGVFGLVHTKFETTPEGRFYTPNGWIGLAVTALFVGRLVARFATLYLDPEAMRAAAGASPGMHASPFAGVQRSPLTLAIFFVMAAYYVVYYGGVLRKLRSTRPTPSR